MCQITDAKPCAFTAWGWRLTDEIAADMYNYGQFQVVFADGSIGWYEAGWGPMMSEVAFFVKDIISPNGAVSIVDSGKEASSDIDGHTKVGGILLHRPSGDCLIPTADESRPSGAMRCRTGLCAAGDCRGHRSDPAMQDAVQSLRICLAADESIRTGRVVDLQI